MATTLATTLLTTSSEATEIIAVRIGRHPEFTRVVFELDRAAGYRIERSDPASDVAELVISLDARSIPRRVRSSKSLVKYVEVEPFGARSIARIRLVSNGLRLKEMILANPPRIVLDVISDRKASPVVTRAAKTATTQTKKIEPVPAPKEEAVPSLDEPTFDEIVAQLPAETEPVPVVVAEPVEPVPPEPVVEIPVEMTPKPDPAVPELDAPSLPETIVDDEPSTSTPIEEPGSDESEMLADEDTSTGTPRPMVAKSEPSTWQRQDWMTWAFAGLGSVVLLFGGILATRRLRGGEEEVDFSGADSDFGTPDSMQAGNDVNPFSAGSADATIVSSSDDEKQSESVVFGGSEEKSMEDMEVISRNQVNESLGGMPAAAGGIPEEFQQMMREMNQRVEALEGRIDELVDARDRLERQVAAQTEELRVQRAAIARTQRAVRNLARPEGGEGEQEATEPALRDPK